MLRVDLSNTLITVSDKAILLDALSSVRELIYKNDQAEVVKKIEKLVPERFSSLITATFSDAKNIADLDKKISKLEKNVAKIPVAHLVLSYEPTKFQVGQLSTRIRTKLQADAIIDYSIDQSMGLGIQIDFNGKSYKRTLEEIIK